MPLHGDGDGPTDVPAGVGDESVHRAHGLPVERHDPVPRHEAGNGGGRDLAVQDGLHRVDDRPGLRWCADRGQIDREDEERHHEMRHRAGRDHRCPLPDRLGSKGPREVFRLGFLERVHAGDPDVTTERERLHTVFGLPSTGGPYPWAEPDEELLDLDLERLGREEVARLVDQYHQKDGDDEQNDPDPLGHLAAHSGVTGGPHATAIR